jgi:subtilase family serine protease
LGAAQPPQRLHANISDGETFQLKGNTRPAIINRAAVDQGKVSASRVMPRMSLHFTLSPAQSADLEQLLRAQQDRRSLDYHRFLTPEQYAGRFGMNSADLARITWWLENSGFSNVQISRSRTWVSFSGRAAAAESAFHTSIHQYLLHGETHFANASDPHLPKALQGLVQSVGGLHNFAMRPHLRVRHPNFTSGISGNHFLAPDDWATIYNVQPLYGAGLDGTGVTIAIMGQSDVVMTDIAAFRAAAGLPANNPTVIVPPGYNDPGIQSSTGDETESDLDLEWAGGIAKNASILFVTASATTGNGVEDALTYAIDNNVAPIMSVSYGSCEADEATGDFNAQTSLYQQAVVQGITILASSGDWGATGCDYAANETIATKGLAVEFPASSQYVTAVGGTEFYEGGGTYWNSVNNNSSGSAVSYIPENAWNDGLQSGATGGGASMLVTKPDWQTGAGVPADGARDVPTFPSPLRLSMTAS